MTLFIGLMSGTSLDGVDAVLADFDESGRSQVLAQAQAPMPSILRTELLALNARDGRDELHRAALAANALARLYSGAVASVLASAGRGPDQVRALGAHGQTVRHRPGEFDATGYTVQLLNGALLAELSGIDTVCNLRSRDVAAGGQGAPLVPAFHAEVFADPDHPVAVLNLGGIANLTLLSAGARDVRGFDCGPGNMLLDLWCEQHLGQPYDADGGWAARGHVDEALLATMLADPFFQRPPPKSTGRDLFDHAWLVRALGERSTAPGDVQATLVELTARAAADALRWQAPSTARLLVCGGGAANGHLMRRLAALLPGMPVQPTDAAGVPAKEVEALAFAWLARAFVRGECGNLPAVTGARGRRILGALYPAGRKRRSRPQAASD